MVIDAKQSTAASQRKDKDSEIEKKVQTRDKKRVTFIVTILIYVIELTEEGYSNYDEGHDAFPYKRFNCPLLLWVERAFVAHTLLLLINGSISFRGRKVRTVRKVGRGRAAFPL